MPFIFAVNWTKKFSRVRFSRYLSGSHTQREQCTKFPVKESRVLLPAVTRKIKEMKYFVAATAIIFYHVMTS